MEGTRAAVSIRWPALRRRKMLVTVVTAVVVTTMFMTVNHDPTVLVAEGTVASVVERKPPKSFIPNSPKQTLIGKPADIPRRFLIEEADACRRQGDDVEVVAYVHSAISKVEERRQTRLTWANSTALNMVVVFMVGRAKNDQEREIVRRESELYHDIVQGDYGDHYHLLTYKALSSLYWITRNCAHVPWTLHADDDLLIDTFILQKFMQNITETPEEDKLHCSMAWHASVLRRGKWKVSRRELKAKKYPPYCQGFIWFVNTRQVFRMLEASASVNYLWVDDVYITGYLAKEVNMGFSDIKDYINRDIFNTTKVGKNIAWYHIKNDNRTNLWPIIVQHHNISDDEISFVVQEEEYKGNGAVQLKRSASG